MLKTTDGMFGSGVSITRLVHYLDLLNLDVEVLTIPGITAPGDVHETNSREESQASYGLEIETLVPMEVFVLPPEADVASSPQAEEAVWAEVSKQLELPNCTFMRVADLWFGHQRDRQLVGFILQESHTACHRPDKQGSMVGLIILFDRPSAELLSEIDYLAQKEDLGIYYINDASGFLIPIKHLRRKYSCQTQSIRQLQLDL